MNINITSADNKSPTLPITQKKGPKNDTRIRILVLTGNIFKQKEFESDLGVTYGANVTFIEPPKDVSKDVLDEFVRKILIETTPSPHYILREESKIYDAAKRKVLSGEEVVEHPEKAPRFVECTSKLRVWEPIWNKNSLLLEKLDSNKYFHEIKGHIDTSRKELRQKDTFGWDHLFVAATNGLTNSESIEKGYGKIAPRQLVISDFVTSHLFYTEPQSLTYHPELKPTEAIEFSKEMSVFKFVESNQYLSNPHLHIWGLDEIRQRILDEGVYFRAAGNRVQRNFFSPPLGGVPLTPKKSPVEETVFMMHDLNHHNIPDLIFDGDDSVESRNVYLVCRMMSEAMTMVMADMFYANTLFKTDPRNRESLDTRIYPLFEALDIEAPTDSNRIQLMRKLLWANTQYAVLGEDIEWIKLLKPDSQDKLDAYKKHFEKFFVGDHVWTAANYKNMAAKKASYKSWVNTLGKDYFKSADLILLSDMVEQIRKRGADLRSIKDVVRVVFDEIFETRIMPQNPEKVKKIDDDERLSRGFRRYIIGQMSFYSQYEHFATVKERGVALAEKLKAKAFFGPVEREELLKQYKEDVYSLWGSGIITTETADNFMHIHPIFPPVYINYAKQECATVKEVLEKLYGDVNGVKK